MDKISRTSLTSILLFVVSGFVSFLSSSRKAGKALDLNGICVNDSFTPWIVMWTCTQPHWGSVPDCDMTAAGPAGTAVWFTDSPTYSTTLAVLPGGVYCSAGDIEE